MGGLSIVNCHITNVNYQEPETAYKHNINLKMSIPQTQKGKKKNEKVG